MEYRKDFDLSGRHLVIGMPVYDGTFPKEFVESLIETMALCRHHGVTVTTAARSGSALIDKARDEVVHGFLHHTDGTDLLFIDSDIVWKADDVLRLLAFASPDKIVCGPYPAKQDKASFYYDLKPNSSGKIIVDEHGLVQLKSAPEGFSMVQRSGLLRMIDGLGDLRYTASRGEYKGETLYALHLMYLRENADGTHSRIGEDIAFCNRWVRSGGEIWMDPSIDLGHIGKKMYRHNFADWLTTS